MTSLMKALAKIIKAIKTGWATPDPRLMTHAFYVQLVIYVVLDKLLPMRRRTVLYDPFKKKTNWSENT